MLAINKAAVIGAGTMGLGIAGQLANAGIDVVLLDLPAESGDRNAICERALQRLMDPEQPGLTHPRNLARITIGNIEDDLGLLADVDWIAEAIVERLELKRALYRQIEAHRKRGSIVSSNTSTIPIALLVEGMPAEFRAEFAITHFFNPVRYMQLLEIVRGEDTRPDVIACLASFNEQRMGKGIVVCNDTPGFLGNRVGVFAIQTALHAAFARRLRPEQADAIFGRPMGIPKTGVFGLYDLIGIDLMGDVVKSLVSILPAADEFHAVAAEIPLMQRMIASNRIGNKGAAGGFYRAGQGDNARQTLDFDTFDYRAFDTRKPEVAALAEAAGDFTLLLQSDDEFGEFAWEVLSRTLCYAASLVPDVNESLVAVDDAMKLGYNWLQGPMQMIDAIGVDQFILRLEREGRDVPGFVRVAAGRSFYRVHDGTLQYLRADGRYADLRRPAGVVRFGEMRRTLTATLSNDSASYFPLENDVGLLEFHSKANTLDAGSMQLLADAVEHASAHCRGLVIHNDAAHFSCGVNLGSILEFVETADWHGLDEFLRHFQDTVRAMRDAPIPVVAAPSGLSLGGGFEVVLHADRVVFHANSVTGLVETLVGVLPGGGGVKEMLYRWYAKEADITKAAWQTFMNIGYGKTARSPLEAEPLAMFRPQRDRYVMNRDRLLASALDEIDSLVADYSPQRPAPLRMPGRGVWDDMQEWLRRAHADSKLTCHDVTTGTQVARVVCGGDVDPGSRMSEGDLCALERSAFVSLAKTPQTRARIEHMLATGRPLRN